MSFLRRSSGVTLLTTLILALVTAMIVHTALRASVLEAKSAQVSLDSRSAQNFASVLAEVMARRTVERFVQDDLPCPLDRYCVEAFPLVEDLIRSAPSSWEVIPHIGPLTVPASFRAPEHRAFSSSAAPIRVLEARVDIRGPAPISLALGFAFPETRR